MTPEQRARIQSAIPHVKLRDIVLYEAHLTRGEQPPDPLPKNALLQNLRGVEAAYTPIEDPKPDEGVGTLQVVVSLGVRMLPEQEKPESEDAKTLFSIEASYVVEYDCAVALDEEVIRDFANFNVVHNAWPFWRQHVHDVIDRARLPKVVIPLFSGEQ